MNLLTAEVIAHELITLLGPACAKIEIAGSVRRRKAEPHDVELVAVPIVESMPGMFADVSESVSLLEGRIGELVAGGMVAFDGKVKRNGARYKRLLRGDVGIDLFIADADGSNYGNLLCIRTGDAEFSHMLVTPRRGGGLMPGNLAQRDGYLWQGREKIACNTERDFFDALGIQLIEPQFRNLANARNLARHAAIEESHA